MKIYGPDFPTGIKVDTINTRDDTISINVSEINTDTILENNLFYASNNSEYTLNEFISEIDTDEQTLIIDREISISSNLTIPDNIKLEISNEGSIVSSSTTEFYLFINYNSEIISNVNNYIFQDDYVRVIFLNGQTVFPEWWGVEGDTWNNANETDNTEAFERCTKCFFNDSGTTPMLYRGRIKLSAKDYWTYHINMYAGTLLEGDGQNLTKIHALSTNTESITASNGVINVLANASGQTASGNWWIPKIENLTILGIGVTIDIGNSVKHGIYVEAATEETDENYSSSLLYSSVQVKDCYILLNKDDGIRTVGNRVQTLLQNIKSMYNGGIGAYINSSNDSRIISSGFGNNFNTQCICAGGSTPIIQECQFWGQAVPSYEGDNWEDGVWNDEVASLTLYNTINPNVTGNLFEGREYYEYKYLVRIICNRYGDDDKKDFTGIFTSNTFKNTCKTSSIYIQNVYGLTISGNAFKAVYDETNEEWSNSEYLIYFNDSVSLYNSNVFFNKGITTSNLSDNSYSTSISNDMRKIEIVEGIINPTFETFSDSNETYTWELDSKIKGISLSDTATTFSLKIGEYNKSGEYTLLILYHGYNINSITSDYDTLVFKDNKTTITTGQAILKCKAFSSSMLFIEIQEYS